MNLLNTHITPHNTHTLHTLHITPTPTHTYTHYTQTHTIHTHTHTHTPFLLGLGCGVGLEVFRAGTGEPCGDLCSWLLLLPLPPSALCTPSTHLLRSSSSSTWKRCSAPLAHTTLNMCFFLEKSLTASTEEVVRSSGGSSHAFFYEGGREGGREGGGREGRREGGREGGRERGREGVREGGRKPPSPHQPWSRLVPPPPPPLIKTTCG